MCFNGQVSIGRYAPGMNSSDDSPRNSGLPSTKRMQVDWHSRRERLPSYLADILVIAEGTGRRIGAVRQLRYHDLRLCEGQHGKVQWPPDTDKTGKTWLPRSPPR
jgi:hypothetical protein